VYGNWSTCSYANACSLTGTRTRSVTTYTCGSGSCNASTTTETDSSTFCNRTTNGDTCSPTTYGNYTACSYATTCANGGSRTRPYTAYTCNSSGACVSSAGTETDTAGCGRNTDGTQCRAAAGLCDAVELCANGSCPADVLRPAGSVCRGSNPQTCDFTSETCNGSSINCPSNTGGCSGSTHCCPFDGCVCALCECP
jgi:hypothetical protein